MLIDNPRYGDEVPFCQSSGMMMMPFEEEHIMLGGSQPGGYVMYMDGFHFTLARGNPCLNLYFSSWTLDTPAKFWCAMIGITLLGIVTEGISKVRSLISKRFTGSTKRWSITFFHGLQALVGYILMLATMTFSVELFVCVILGLGLGFAIFYDDEKIHVTTNPCCNFIQEEFYERATALRRESMIEQEAKEEQQVMDEAAIQTTDGSEDLTQPLLANGAMETA
mmetsp:Transcript_11776/g.18086  ORF Transcript_11776/g.18086 Transcript_11776/m.18086 type:complete len:223 (-) Transcript_11776:646-1314(-)